MAFDDRNDGRVPNLLCKAVLLPLRGEPIKVVMLRYPPPPRYYEPVRGPFRLTPEGDVAARWLSKDRVYELDPSLRDRMHQWDYIYNDGRSKTPRSAFVYREVP